VAGEVDAVETPIGLLPTVGGIDTDGLTVTDDDLQTLLAVDTRGWREAIPQIRKHYSMFDGKMPAQLTMALDALEENLR
jgi:phosphoenolpyruvate carboxykinase (GTP)